MSWDAFLDDLSKKSYAIKDGLFSTQDVVHLRSIAQNLLCEFKPAHVGHKHETHRDIQVRGDLTHWIPNLNSNPELIKVYQVLEEMKKALNEKLFLGLSELEIHWAYYPKGSFYRRHIDTHEKGSSRVLSWICYLNENWQSHHGGELKIYTSPEQIIEPLGGRVIAFLSQELAHEVLETHRERWSLTGWFHHRRDHVL
jgi:SM-20-related protein